MTIALRDYQKEALESVLKEFSLGCTRQLVNLPTGSGKTVIMAALAKEFNKRTLILAHRQELITQTVEKFRLVWPEVSIGVCQAELDEVHCSVVVGSVQSCSRPKRLEKLQQQGFELLMIDEAHHCVADSYQGVINTLGFGPGSNKYDLLLGVTATSDRLGLGDIFEQITFSRSISTMISSGYLSPVIGRKIHTNFSVEKIRTQNGDFSVCELAEAVNTAERNEFVVSKFLEYAENRKTVVFCCDVQHCKDLSIAFKAHGIDCEPVWGDMPPEERKNVLGDLRHGKIQAVTSCGILTEGFDEPSISCIVMARPTKSRSLYIQSVGRGLRIHPSKENCLVLDFSDRFHRLDSAVTLSNIIPVAEIIKDHKEDNLDKEEIDRTAKIETLEAIDKEFDLLGRSSFIWSDIGDDEWSLQDDERREIVMRSQEEGYVAEILYPDGSSQVIVKNQLPLSYCQGVCEDFARRHLKLSLSDTTSPWMREIMQPTQGQRTYLEKAGQWDDGLTKAKATIKIRGIVALKNKRNRSMASEPATSAQKYFLQNRDIDASTMTKLQAMHAINKIKNETATKK